MTKIGNNYYSYLMTLLENKLLFFYNVFSTLSHRWVIVLQYESHAYHMSHLLRHKDLQVNYRVAIGPVEDVWEKLSNRIISLGYCCQIGLY